MSYKRVHIAIAVSNLQNSIKFYQKKFSCKPVIIKDGKYALFRTDVLNLSLKQIDNESKENKAVVRHLGIESSDFISFTEEHDPDGIIWESFNSDNQDDEIINHFGGD